MNLATMVKFALALAIFPGIILIPLYLVGWVRTPFEIIVVGLLLMLVQGILWIKDDDKK